MIEKAIFISKIANLKYMSSRYTRLYFGNEFCQKLLPSINELEKVLNYCGRKKLSFSLVTPYVTDEGLKDVEQLLIFLKNNKLRLNCEVIINDWGVLDMLNEKDYKLQPVLGRLLTKQSRDPRISSMINRKSQSLELMKLGNKRTLIFMMKPPSTLASYYKESNTNVPVIRDFLLKQRINRIDLDNLFQGINISPGKDNLFTSLYVPYGYIATTRLCSANPFQNRVKYHCRISFCKKECQKYTLRIENPVMLKTIFKKGNTIFFKNTKVPSQRYLKEKGINRLVYQPEIPV